MRNAVTSRSHLGRFGPSDALTVSCVFGNRAHSGSMLPHLRGLICQERGKSFATARVAAPVVPFTHFICCGFEQLLFTNAFEVKDFSEPGNGCFACHLNSSRSDISFDSEFREQCLDTLKYCNAEFGASNGYRFVNGT